MNNLLKLNADTYDCPACGADWRDEPITDQPGRFYSRLIGVEWSGTDRICEWLCPDCGTRWPR